MSNELTQLYAARLAESEVSMEAAKYAGLTLLQPDTTQKLWVGAPRQGAIRIVYHSPAGKATSFFRLRLLGTAQGLNGQSSKPRRYLQPPDSGVRAYLPRVKGVKWAKILSDPEIPLIITEGEFKALSACLHGLPTIGLGGVENWRSAKMRKPLIDELEACEWDGRATYIAYDSDVATKPQVAEASRRLADELGARGAHVYDAGLPSSGEKVGLDDFLRDRGVKALERHLSEALEFSSVQQLHEFNDRFLFIRASGSVYEPARSAFYPSAQFVNATEANAQHVVMVVGVNGKPKIEKRSTARDWLSWPQRRTVQQLTYAPGDERLILPSEQGPELNLWRGWGCAPAKGDLRPWVRLFDHITSGENDTVRDWFEKWLAYPIQHPGEKMYAAVAVWGATQGTGKTLLGETMMKIYGKNAEIIGARQLSATYNGWMERKQFILGDEITGSDSRQYADELKNLITSESIRVNEKYEKEYTLPNCVNFYFTSQQPDAFFLDDTDRRYLIIEAPFEPLPTDFYTEYRKWMRSVGPAALFHYLLRLPLGDFNPRAHALRTHAKDVMTDQGKSEVGRFIACVLLDPEKAAGVYGVPRDVELFTAAELRTFFDPLHEKRATEKAVSLELQKQGAVKVLKGQQVRIEGKGRFRLYALRNVARWNRVTSVDEVLRYMSKRTLPTAKF